MKIAIDISPLQTGHKVRGVGFYLQHLKDTLVRYYPENDYYFFTKQDEIPDNSDVVHYPYFDPFFLTLPFFQKKKTVVTVHDLTPLIFPKYFPAGMKGKLFWQIQRFNLQRSTLILTDSYASQADIVSIAGIPKRKVAVAYLAAAEEFQRISQTKAKYVKEKYKLPDQFVLYVGDVTWNKNLPRLVRAMKQLALPLVMVGKSLVEKNFDKTNPWNRDLVDVQQLTEDDKRIIKLGFLPTEDLVALYNSATVFVFPSLYEGFGLPILEAMQSGCPVITTKEGSLPEVAGNAAHYVDAYDVESIAKGIGEIFFSQKLQKECTDKGLEQAKKFSWQKTAEQTIATYKKVL